MDENPGKYDKFSDLPSMQTPLAENAPVVNKRPLDLALDEVAAHVALAFAEIQNAWEKTHQAQRSKLIKTVRRRTNNADADIIAVFIPIT